jgi:hypothetical protein
MQGDKTLYSNFILFVEMLRVDMNLMWQMFIDLFSVANA